MRVPATARSTARAVHLQAAHPRAPAGGERHDLLAHREVARHERAGDHGAEALHREDPVDGQAEEALRGAGGDSRARASSASRSAGSPSPVRAETRTTGRPSRNEPGHELPHLELGERLAVRVGDVALRERDEAARHAQEPADVEVLAGLGHDRLVGGHHQGDRVDAVRARQHVPHEPLVAGHVHEGGDDAFPELGVGEAEVDRDPALLLLLQAVGVGAGERAHEGALAVVDVAGGPDDEGAQGRVSPRGW